MIQIERIINRPVSSNCYVISIENSKSCIIVDPGTEDCKELFEFLKIKSLYPDYIVFTHEHVDHIIGTENIQKHYRAKIICSSSCGVAMQSSKFNLTRMTEQWDERLSMPEADIVLEDICYHLTWNGCNIQFYKAEGHSKGSIYFTIDNNLFIGDTIIKGFRTTTVLPGASKENLIITLNKILQQFDFSKTLVYSGHYDPFFLSEVIDEIDKQISFFKNKIL